MFLFNKLTYFSLLISTFFIFNSCFVNAFFDREEILSDVEVHVERIIDAKPKENDTAMVKKNNQENQKKQRRLSNKNKSSTKLVNQVKKQNSNHINDVKSNKKISEKNTDVKTPGLQDQIKIDTNKDLANNQALINRLENNNSKEIIQQSISDNNKQSNTHNQSNIEPIFLPIAPAAPSTQNNQNPVYSKPLTNLPPAVHENSIKASVNKNEPTQSENNSVFQANKSSENFKPSNDIDKFSSNKIASASKPNNDSNNSEEFIAKNLKLNYQRSEVSISPENELKLSKIIEIFKNQENKDIKIVGFGSDNSIDDLNIQDNNSLERVISIRKYLISKGISSKHIKVQSSINQASAKDKDIVEITIIEPNKNQDAK